MTNRAIVRAGRSIVAALLLTGCSSTTLVAKLGVLSDGSDLVTLTVTNDLKVVEAECADVVTNEVLMGCERSIPAVRARDLPVRRVTVVRYTETVPTRLSFDIEARALCHTVAALQLLSDICETETRLPLGATEAATLR